MKRKTTMIAGMVLLAAIVFTCGCKKTAGDTVTLTVVVSAGVSGIPEAGVYTMESGYDLSYRFTLKQGYSKLTVLFDDAEIAASGTIAIADDRTLQAYADDNIQYALTVTLADGVSGTPAAGTANYAKGSLVNYSYALEEGFSDLAVTLDGETVASSGTITMSQAHALKTSASTRYNVQGSWLLAETYDDDSSFSVTAVFSGNYTGGTVTDSDGGSGTYAVDADQAVTFNLVFPDVTYEYEGDFSDDDTMSGTCERYQTDDNVISGTWTATRSSAAAAAGSSSKAIPPRRR